MEKVIRLNGLEQRILVRGMNEFRNRLLAEGMPTEDVDSVMCKIIDAPERRPFWRRWCGER
jgi:hypothetical protein